MTRSPFASLSALALAALLLAVAPGCRSPAPLRVGFTPNYAPLCMMVLDDSQGAVGGIEADFAAALGRELSCPVAPVILPFDDQFAALRENRIDIAMAGLTVTSARSSLVAFCPPYMKNPLVALARADEAASFRTQADVDAVASVGVLEGSSAESFARRHFTHSHIVLVSKRKDVPSLLAASRFRIYVDDYAAAHALAAQNEASVAILPYALHPQSLAWAVAPDNTELLGAASAALRKWRANGFLEKTIRSYLPDSPVDLMP